MEKAEVGDRLVVESEHVGVPAREGEVLEVIGTEDAIHYLVRWEDGHRTFIYPSVGSTAVVHHGPRT
jgi:hypothetical protein